MSYSARSARRSAVLRFIPPLSSRTGRLPQPPSPTSDSAASSASCEGFPRITSRRFDITERFSQSRFSWNTALMRPSRSMLPLSGGIIPISRLSSVVLPQPDCPISAVTAPEVKSWLNPLITGTSPNDFVMFSALSIMHSPSSQLLDTFHSNIHQQQKQLFGDKTQHDHNQSPCEKIGCFKVDL